MGNWDFSVFEPRAIVPKFRSFYRRDSCFLKNRLSLQGVRTGVWRNTSADFLFFRGYMLRGEVQKLAMSTVEAKTQKR